MPTNTLKVTSKGQITLKKDLLNYMGIEVGENVQIELLADNSIKLTPIKQKPIESMFGFLKDKTSIRLTPDELEDAIQQSHERRG